MTPDEKHELADHLTKVIGGCFRVTFAPHYEVVDESFGNPVNPSVGHLWYAEFHDDHRLSADPAKVFMDDRDGDVRPQLVEALRRRSRLYARMAERVENDAARKPSRRKSRATA